MKNITIKPFVALAVASLLMDACKKSPTETTPPNNTVTPIAVSSVTIGNQSVNNGATLKGVSPAQSMTVRFTNAVNRSTVGAGITLSGAAPAVVYSHGDSVVQLAFTSMGYLGKYVLNISTALQSAHGAVLSNSYAVTVQTGIDSSRKFPAISDSALLTLVEQQTFKYFWDFGHPISGLARERSNGDNETITTGGSGFGIMSIPVAVYRGFIGRADGLARMQKIVAFLKTSPQRFHGAFAHWINGTTGAVIPFSANDDGADLVETSYLMAGLITARQFFNGADANETALRTDINSLWNAVEWDWFTQGGKSVLYWHWSPDKGWAMNVPIQGWNECLITYVLAAASTAHTIPKAAYDSGFARSGAMANGNTFLGYRLPLGPDYGGPLFFAHYSFLGINPNSLKDSYADYWLQNTDHAKINNAYCTANAKGYYGYSDSCWGLTASDIPNGYNASSPTNDLGVIAPTAAISSLPYTPVESMKALKFYYYALGDKLWKGYGFVDAFSLDQGWFADSFLAIDQGPQIVMMENYRTNLVWNLFTSAPEIKAGLKKLGFSANYVP